MKKTLIVIILILAVIITVIALRSNGIRRWECNECGKGFFGHAYYGWDGDESMCSDCAREYWMPFPYEEYAR